LELDPLSNVLNFFAAYAYYMARDYDKAIQQFKKNIEMDPNDLTSRSFLAVLYSERAMHNDALTEVQEVIDLSGGKVSKNELYNFAYVYLTTGKRDKASEVLEELIARRNVEYIPSAYIAIIYSELGQKDLAIEWLERAYEEHDTNMVELKVNPRFDSFRSDFRFQDLLRRMNFPE
jgi:tetratricopeptide (TPR) repeat protein